MEVQNWIVEEIEKAFVVEKHCSFKEFLEKGFSLNKEDLLGTFKSDLTPWVLEVAKWVDDPKVEWIHLVQAAQTSKTTVEMAFLIYISKIRPTRILWVQSTEEEAKQFISERLKPYIQDYDKDAILRKGWKTEAFKVYEARVKIGYATNEQTLRSLPAQYVIGDECAVWKNSAALVKKRTRTYTGNRKGIFATTPPKSAEHHSWKEACSGNFYRWYVPCPKCGEYQPLIMPSLMWCKKEGDSWDLDKVRSSTRYKCFKCGDLWHNSIKPRLIKNGKLVCVDPNDGYKEIAERETNTRTLQISSLYSVFTPWGETAINFIEAKHNGVDAMKLFITDELAEIPYDLDTTCTIQDGTLSKFIDSKRNSEFKDGFDAYTAGVDVQRNGELYIVVLGWRKGAMPSSHVLIATTAQMKTGDFTAKWTDFLAFFAPFQNKIARVTIDSTDGMVRQDILDFCNFAGNPFMPLTDSTGLHMKTLIKNIAPEVNGKKIGRVQNVLVINSDKIKDDIAASFQREPGTDGAWTFPGDISQEFLKAMTTEHRAVSKQGKSSWMPKYSGAQNHYFSALVYATAAMEEFRPILQNNLRNVSKAINNRIIASGINIWKKKK